MQGNGPLVGSDGDDVSNVEYCGAPYDHDPHTWREGPAVDPEVHRCSGVDDEQAEIDAGIASADELFERGGY